MKISKRSWHYRFLVWAWGPPPDNLCSYVAALVLTMLLLALFLVLLPFVLPVVGLVVVVGGLAVVVVGGLARGIEMIGQGRPAKSPSPPGLLPSWLRAKKEKVCPRLEWTE